MSNSITIAPFIPFAFAVVGLLMYVGIKEGKWPEVGRVMFAVGLLVFLFYLGSMRFS